ncbi:hypothetical protein [Myxosarcina sp. GI1]|uniref:hypothetical protein n=1 Tax=Myxosarcina sp. GI1 TaxID=1541065 RepID=UPI00056338D6|nr:hypothetical protein [Myxosarcina sp. GI1]
MLDPKQLELLKKSNKTLAIIGRFNSEDEQIRYVFKNSGGKDGKISVADLFAKLKPELRSSSKGTLPIGDTIFNQYELDTPLKVKNKGYSQPILFDSPLLDGTVYSGEEAKGIQQQGKEVVRQLVESLDTVAYFTHSHFTKSLLKIAKHYLFLEANEHLEHKIAEDAQWYKTINSDNSFCSVIVQYLTAHEQDEPEIETAFRKSLKSFKDDSGQIYKDEQVDKLAEALIRCKRVMLDRAEDETWSKIAKTKNFSWLKNYPSDPDYGISHPQIGKKIGDKNFLAYYNGFIDASDKIHRLVRTQAIHSSVFCWLASKYQEWDVTSQTEAGGKMYSIGVEDQGDKRIRGESREAKNRNLKLIQEAKVAEQIANQIEGDSNYLIFAEKAEDNIFAVLLPDRAVTLKDLRLRAKNTFKKLNQIAGGKAGQLLKENDEFNQLFVKYYRTILNTDPDTNAEAEEQVKEFSDRLSKQAARDKEAEKFKDFNIKEFIDAVIDEAKQEEGDKSFKVKVKEAFVKEFARKSKNRFAEEYLKNQVQIKNEEQLAHDLYDLRSGHEVIAKEETAGSPVYVMTDLSMPDFESIDKDIKKARKQKTQQAVQTAARSSLITSVTAPKPKVLELIPANTSGEVTDGEGNKIGSYKIQENNIELEAEDIQTAEYFDSAEAEIQIEDKTYKVQELDIPELMDFPKADEIERINTIAETTQNNYEQLSRSMDKILSKYRDEYSEEPDPDFNRAFRSLLLCEYIQAAPKGTTQIGREDLSNILGLMVDIVEHLGEVDNSKILDGVLSKEPELLQLLQKINLSQYYPVEEGDTGKRNISKILQYHYELCKKLNNVQQYLQELAEIKSFFEIMQRTDLEIVFLNTTVQEYGDIYKIDDYETFSFNADCPSVVYLTSQSEASEGLTTLAETLAQLIEDTDNASNLQIPIFVSPQNLLADKVPLPLPLVCPTTEFNLPNLVIDESGSSDKQKLNIVVDWSEHQNRNSYLLLSTATMLPDSSLVMGSVENFKPPVSMKIRKDFDINLSKNQTVVDLLRHFWLSPNCKLLDNLIFTKWLNVIILAKRKDPSINIKEQFGQILDEKLWDTKELPDICHAAFSTVKELADLSLKVELNNQFARPTALGGGNFSITDKYGTSLEQEEQYIFELPWKEIFAKEIK